MTQITKIVCPHCQKKIAEGDGTNVLVINAKVAGMLFVDSSLCQTAINGIAITIENFASLSSCGFCGRQPGI